MDRRRRILLILATLLFVVAAACGCHFWRELQARDHEQQVFEILEEEVALPELTPSPVQENSNESHQEIIQHDASALTATNRDYVGWLTIPGTVINYPIMYSPSEPERYLHLDFYGQYSYSGTPFLDARCDPNEGNLIIYGHNMINGTMFGTLKSYRNEDYMNNHKTIYLELADGVHAFEVISAVTLEKTDPWYSFLHASSSDEEAAWVSDLKAKHGVHTSVTPNGTERLLTLSTCTGNRRTERMILVAKEKEG